MTISQSGLNQTFKKHPKWHTFLFKTAKNVTFCVMKYSSSKKIFAAQFYHSKTWLKVKIKNKSAKKNEQICKKMNKSAKK
jgi:hypothetical protein